MSNSSIKVSKLHLLTLTAALFARAVVQVAPQAAGLMSVEIT